MAAKWKVSRKTKTRPEDENDPYSTRDQRLGAFSEELGRGRAGMPGWMRRLARVTLFLLVAVICGAVISALDAVAYSCRAHKVPGKKLAPAAQPMKAALALSGAEAPATAAATAGDESRGSQAGGGDGQRLGLGDAGGGSKGDGAASVAAVSQPNGGRIITPPAGLAMAAKVFLTRDLQAMYESLNTTSREKGVLLAGALAAYSETVAKSRDVAFLTVASSRDDVKRHVEAVLMNVMYALNHGHAFLIHEDPSFAASKCINNSIPEYLHKISAISSHLQHYGAIVYLDINAMIYNEPMKDLFHGLLYKHPEVSPAQVYVADNAGRINSGLVMVKNSSLGVSFLQEWRDQSAECGCSLEQCGSDIPLASAIIGEVTKIQPSPDMSCADPQVCAKGKAHLCLKEQRNCRGLGYNNGISIGSLSILPQNDPALRVNEWYARDAPLKEREAEGFYKPGDTVVRGKHLRDILYPSVFTGRLRTALTSITEAARA